MTETRFTPGPWEAADRGDYGDYNGNCRVILADDMRIAVVHDYGADESEATARLITAAPDIFAALPDLSHVIVWLENGCDPKNAAKELRIYQARINAALSRASEPLSPAAGEDRG